MNKQQAAEKALPMPENGTLQQIKRTHYDRNLWIAGWEAHEAQQSPPAAGLVSKEQKINLIWKVIEYFQEVRLNDEKCQDMDLWNDVVLSYNDVEAILYEMLEKIDPKVDHKKPSTPVPAGPVWVKCSDRMPKLPSPLPPDTPDERPIIFLNMKHSATRLWFPSYGQTAESSFPLEIDIDRRVYDEGFGRENWEWLDESPRQVFTREQVAKAFSEGVFAAQKQAAGQTHFTEEEYMELYYPLTK